MFESRPVVRSLFSPRPSSVHRWMIVAFLALVPGVARAVTVPPNFVVENAIPGAALTAPVGIAFIPGGRMLVCEKSGRVFVVKNGVLNPTPMWSRESEVLNVNDRGLLDVAVDPNYVTNHYVYLLYTVDPDSNGVEDNLYAFGRLTRYQVSFSDSNALDPASRTVLMGVTWPKGPASHTQSHTIGALRWGTDGSLLVSAGDGALYSQPDAGGNYPAAFGAGKTDPIEDIGAFRSQYVGSLSGKVLRINPATGKGYASNPYYDGNLDSPRSKVWAYGLRNPFRFAVRPGSGNVDPNMGRPGTLYISDVGWETWEEINIATAPGQNFGWPCWEGGYAHFVYPTLNPARAGCGTLGTSDNPASSFSLPTVFWHHTGADWGSPPGFKGRAAIAGCFYTRNVYPTQYRNRFFFADFDDGWVQMLTTDATDQFVSLDTFGTDFEGPVDFVADPVSGDLYYVSIYAGEVRRIRYIGGGGTNSPPVALASGSPTTGATPLTVTFSSAGTTDPDADPMTLSWLFGDLTGSNQANPTHTFNQPGTYRVELTADDQKGGISRDTVVVVAVDAAASFPATPVRDDFNRADGAIGGSWLGNTAGLALSGGAVVESGTDGWAIWNGAQFGNLQEVYFRLDQVTAGADEHDLMLKVQGFSWQDGEIEVRYSANLSEVYVSTFTPGPGWQSYGAPIPLVLQAGDQFGARAYPDGTVEIYVDGLKIATRSVAGWAFADQGGRVGFTLVGATTSRLDNFGGGTVVAANTPPVASILGPADGSFFITGDVIQLHASATDAQQPADSLTYHWQIDLHHNTHIHPSSYVADGKNASYTILDHEDGTGIWHEIKLFVTDRGGLKDTVKSFIYPEVDLAPSTVTIVPDPPSAQSTSQYRFKIFNTGRMVAPISRWFLVAGSQAIAYGDTVVNARDSVQIIATLPPSLGPGSYSLRVVVDSLGAVFETTELNNAVMRTVTINSPTAVMDADPSSVALSGAFPNPSMGETRLELQLPRAAHVEFSVLDLQGRQVWSERARDYPAGSWTLKWPGLNAHGEHAAPGLYVARLHLGGRTITRRLALVR